MRDYYKYYNIPTMSDSEMQQTSYYALNKDKIREYKKKWAEKNKEKLKESHKKWREANAETIKKKKAEYYKTGYYNNKLIQKFNIMRGEILLGNDSKELLEDFKHLLNEMCHRDIIDEDEYDGIMVLIN